MAKVSHLLFDEHPIVLLPSLARLLGVNHALFIQQIHYWLQMNEKAGKNQHAGYTWVYNSYEEWAEQLTWISAETIKRIALDLEKQGVLLSIQGVTDSRDRTKWYRIDYEKLNDLHDAMCKKYTMDSVKNTRSNVAKIHDVSTTETNTETTTDRKDFAEANASAERESTNSGNPAQNNPYTGFQDTAKPKRTRKPNPLFDAIAHEIFGFDENVGKAGGRIGKVLSAMQMLKADVTAEDVSKFVVWYQGKYPNIALPQDDAKASKYFNDWLKVTSKQASPTPSMTFRKVASVQDVVSAGKSFYRVVMKNHFDKWVTIKAFNRMDDAIGFQLDYAQFAELKTLVKVEGE